MKMKGSRPVPPNPQLFFLPVPETSSNLHRQIDTRREVISSKSSCVPVRNRYEGVEPRTRLLSNKFIAPSTSNLPVITSGSAT